ncbi:type IV secretory pathway TraG/TraD family ATPase VirD4 [Paenibacillus mucilaginosus]
MVDIKGELTRITSECRGKVYVFDPEEALHAYDPILECQTLDGAQELARALIPEPLEGEPVWAQSAQGIFAAAVLEAAHTGDKLCQVAERVCMTPLPQLIEELQNSAVRGSRLLSSVGVGVPEKTLGSISMELKSKLLTLAADEGIARATSRSDFRPAALEEGATIYIRVAEHMLAQYEELWTVIIGQMLRHLSKRPEKALPGVMVLLDELPRLGKLDKLTESLATLRSRNVHIISVIQSMAQLDLIYGQDSRKVIADNCRYKLVLGASDPETQEYFAGLAGQQTVHTKGVTIGSGWVPNYSMNETGVHLIRPEVWGRLEKPVLFAGGLQPTQLDLAFWDLDKELRQLA